MAQPRPPVSQAGQQWSDDHFWQRVELGGMVQVEGPGARAAFAPQTHRADSAFDGFFPRTCLRRTGLDFSRTPSMEETASYSRMCMVRRNWRSAAEKPVGWGARRRRRTQVSRSKPPIKASQRHAARPSAAQRGMRRKPVTRSRNCGAAPTIEGLLSSRALLDVTYIYSILASFIDGYKPRRQRVCRTSEIRMPGAQRPCSCGARGHGGPRERPSRIGPWTWRRVPGPWPTPRGASRPGW